MAEIQHWTKAKEGRRALAVVYDIEDSYRCEQCDGISDEVDESPLYECGECREIYNRKGTGSNRCPNCNKFGAKLADVSCAQCGGGPVEEVEVVEVEGEYLDLEDAEGRLSG